MGEADGYHRAGPARRLRALRRRLSQALSRRRIDIKAPTIHDVAAAAAGVSKSTVSNVVRGVRGVRGDARASPAAIERLNYKPNAIARQFVTQRTTMLGVLVGDLTNPYYAQMAQVVERAAFGRGYTTMFCNIEGEDAIAATGVEALLEHRVAGVVFLAFIARTDQLEQGLSGPHPDRLPRPSASAGATRSVPVTRQGGELATQHLLGAGPQADRLRPHAAGRAQRRPRAL